MKKTYNINLAGYAFVIDEDAYDILDSYLSTLGQICEKSGQKETAADIEQRIAEIFMEEFQEETGRRILTLVDVESVIKRMGPPGEIVDVEVAPVGGPAVPPPMPSAKVTFSEKRLYRDIDHKVLGGVCAGLAWYLGIDVVWVRIIMVALAFLSGSTMALIYIVLWIAVPAAKSPYEKMQMMGINQSMRNVGRVVTGEFDAVPPKYPSAATTGENVGKVVLMILAIVGLLVSGALLLGLSLAFVGCLVAECVIPANSFPSGGEAKLVMGCVMGGALVLGMPLLLAFRSLIAYLGNRRFAPLTLAQRLCVWLPWLLGVAACIACGIALGTNAG